MTKKQKKVLKRILIAAVLMILIELLPVEGPLKFALYMIPYLTIGHDILKKAWKGICNHQVFDECFLMSTATVGAILLGEYTEGVAVMLFYQIGELFQSYAVGKSRRNISELMDIRPDYANVENETGELEQKDPDEVAVGTVITVKPGEKIPLDGVVTDGCAVLNTAALTGESVPREVSPGDEIISGCVVLNAVLKIRTTKRFGESTVSRILELVENAGSRKSRSENFISRFAHYYTPVVCYSALALAVLPPLVRLILGMSPNPGDWIFRALTFLVISCPCAVVVSVPLSFFAGIGCASNQGILVKGSNYLEALAEAKVIVFDKTGTLTEGTFEVSEVRPVRISETELLDLAAHAEHYSDHPISKSLKKAYGAETDASRIGKAQEISGHGIRVEVDGATVCAGNAKLMQAEGVDYASCSEPGTIVYISRNQTYLGHIHIADRIKAHAIEAIAALKKAGIRETVMLTGDREESAAHIAGALGIDRYFSNLLPDDKVAKLEEILAGAGKKEKVVFVGDGINDAPVLSRADIGIAMGAMGSDAAIEAADVVLMDDDPLKISKAMQISRKCLRIVYENICFAIGVKVLCLLLGALGFANMWLAIFADVGVMVLAVLNAIRCLHV